MSQMASPEDADREVKKGQAFDLRIAGASYREIGKALGLSPATAHTYVTEALGEVVELNRETVERLRQVEKTRLEAVLRSLWAKKDQPRYADSIIRISERLSRLEGLDLGKASGDEPPPPPPSSQLPASITITLVAPAGTKAEVVETKPPAGGTDAPS